MAETRRLDLDGTRICCLTAGEGGSPVVLLHGGGVDSARLSWGQTIDPLAEGHRVFAPDLPGYGQSDKPDVLYSLDYYAQWLSELLDNLQLEQVSLVGLSLGGGIALNFTLQHPQRVSRLVLVSPYGIMPRLAWQRLSYLYVHSPINEWSLWTLRQSRQMVRWTLLAGLISSPERLSDELVEEVYQAAREPDAGKAFASFQRHEVGWNGLRTDFTNRLSEITIPTLFIQGEKDTAVPLKYAQQASERMRNARLLVLSECKHWPQRDKTDEFNQAVASFLNAT
jgi:pimeloyl-ACP methyl ester carboxylesterase